jgi:tetratricopeptide (TPR) repeat protein
MVDDEYEGLAPEIAMYIKRIGDMRDANKFGRAVQLCNLALEHDPETKIRNVILNFKAESLYRVGWKVQNPELMQEARSYYVEVLGIDPNDHVAQVGLEQIDFSS